MSDKFFFKCDCGKKIRVELYEAGTDKECPTCHTKMLVPNSVTLQELSGDKYPLLSPIDKVLKTLEKSDPPFDGYCHVCEEREAEYEIPIQFKYMKERIAIKEGGVGVSITGSLTVGGGKYEEHWETLRFPLLLCEQCHNNFLRTKSWGRSKQIIKKLLFIILLMGVCFLAYLKFDFFAAYSTLFCVVAVGLLGSMLLGSKKGDLFIIPWLNHIRWLSESIASQDEYKVVASASQRIDKKSMK